MSGIQDITPKASALHFSRLSLSSGEVQQPCSPLFFTDHNTAAGVYRSAQSSNNTFSPQPAKPHHHKASTKISFRHPFITNNTEVDPFRSDTSPIAAGFTGLNFIGERQQSSIHRVKNRAPTAKFLSQEIERPSDGAQGYNFETFYNHCANQPITSIKETTSNISPNQGSSVRYESSEEDKTHDHSGNLDVHQISPEQNLRRVYPDMTMDAFIKHLDHHNLFAVNKVSRPSQLDQSLKSLESLPSEFGRHSIQLNSSNILPQHSYYEVVHPKAETDSSISQLLSLRDDVKSRQNQRCTEYTLKSEYENPVQAYNSQESLRKIEQVISPKPEYQGSVTSNPAFSARYLKYPDIDDMNEAIPDLSAQIQEVSRPSRPDSSCLYQHQSSQFLFEPKEEESVGQIDLNDETPLKYPSLKSSGSNVIPPLPLLQSILREKLSPESEENDTEVKVEGIKQISEDDRSMNVLSEIKDSPQDKSALNGTRKANFKKFMENETTERKQKFEQILEKENSPVNSLSSQKFYSNLPKIKLNLAEVLAKTPFKSPESGRDSNSLNFSQEERDIAQREKQVKEQIKKLRLQAAKTVQKTEKSAKQNMMLSHKLHGYDAKLQSFERKILELTEQTEFTKRELETTRQIINDTTFNTNYSPRTIANNTCIAAFTSNSPKLSSRQGTQKFCNMMLHRTNPVQSIKSARCYGARGKGHLISPMHKKYTPQLLGAEESEIMKVEGEESMEVRHFEMDSHFLPSNFTECTGNQFSRKHIISQSPLLSNMERNRASQVNRQRSKEMLINDTYGNLRSIEQLQSQETVKPRFSRFSVPCRELRKSRMTMSSVSSFAFDNDIDEGDLKGKSSPVKELKFTTTPFQVKEGHPNQDLRRSKSVSEISSEAFSLSLSSEDFSTFRNLMKYYQKKITNFQEQHFETERQNARLREIIRELQNQSRAACATGCTEVREGAHFSRRDLRVETGSGFTASSSAFLNTLQTQTSHANDLALRDDTPHDKRFTIRVNSPIKRPRTNTSVKTGKRFEGVRGSAKTERWRAGARGRPGVSVVQIHPSVYPSSAQSFYPRDYVVSDGGKEIVVFKSELTLLDKRQGRENTNCRIL